VNTLLLRHERCLLHDPGRHHPETAERLRLAWDELSAAPPPGLREAAPAPVRREDLLLVHAERHVRAIEATAGGRHLLDADTATSPASAEAAALAAGAVVQAAQAVVAGDAHGAFALVRPPGHHAEPDRAMGFCLYNNVAVAAAHAVAELGLRRVLVVDPDVHHGNGTQHAFWRRRDVLYASSHRWPFYPGTGWIDEIGTGAGEGYTVNLPLEGGASDADVLHAWNQVMTPVVDEYRPELILVSAGFDTWQRDPLGGMRMTAEGFRALFGLYASWARRHCPGRLAIALEGGYDPEGVAAGVRAALEAARGGAAMPEGVAGAPRASTREMVEAVRRELAPFWASVRAAGAWRSARETEAT
jgi:acetoin utilization deacetylase AcuC-like enzyme